MATGTDGRLLVERRFFTFAESADGMALDSGARLGRSPGSMEMPLAPSTPTAATPSSCSTPSPATPTWPVSANNGDARPRLVGQHGRVGAGPIDTNRHFVICSNILEAAPAAPASSSINLATGRPHGLGFPMVTIRDMVRALVKELSTTWASPGCWRSSAARAACRCCAGASITPRCPSPPSRWPPPPATRPCAGPPSTRSSAGDHGRPGPAGRRLLRLPRPGPRAGGGAHDRPCHLPVR